MRSERRRWQWGPATCLANLPPDSGLSLVEVAEVKRERGGEQGRVCRAGPQLPRPAAAVPQDGPPAEAPSSSRLTGILRSLSDTRNRTFGRDSADAKVWRPFSSESGEAGLATATAAAFHPVEGGSDARVGLKHLMAHVALGVGALNDELLAAETAESHV